MIVLPNLDLETLRAFVSVADTRSFTATGAALGATQSTVSTRIRKLEERIGRRLLERNPRLVALTPSGSDFLEDARRILEAHDEAAMRILGYGRRQAFVLGISDHVAGALLPAVLAAIGAEVPDARMQVTVGISAALFTAFERGRFDAVIGRRQDMGNEGTPLLSDRLAWIAADGFDCPPDEPLPFISLAAPCSIRDIAVNTLAARGIPWRSTFVATGVAAVQAATAAGLGVSCLEIRNRPHGCRELGVDDGLPPLPATEIVMRQRHHDIGSDTIVAAIRRRLDKAVSQPT